MSDFEKEHPRDKQGKFVDKHQSVKPDIELEGVHPDVYSDESKVRREIAQHGTNADRMALLARGEEEAGVRRNIAKYGNKECLDTLIANNEEDVFVQMNIAFSPYARDEHLDWIAENALANGPQLALIERKRPQDLDRMRTYGRHMRSHVAAHTDREEDLDFLINDKDPYVRAEVARRGRPQDLDILIEDEDEKVREIAQRIKDGPDRALRPFNT